MFDVGCLPTFLPIYYKKLFPAQWLTKLLKYNDSDYFQRREFAFILPGDIYLRYKSYKDPLDFEKDVLSRVPEKVDIGAVYNYRPQDGRNKKDMCAIERELVFDIDMTDYDDVRSCCKGADICKKCWKFMVIAVKIIDAALEEDFGFTQRLWVFSGRRGVHCWVFDESARKLSSVGRSAIIEYLSIVNGGESKSKKVELKGSTLHPMIERSIRIIENDFFSVLLDQGWLDDEEKALKFVAVISDENLREKVQLDMKDRHSAQQRWQYLTVRQKSELPHGSKHFLEEIMLQQVYPRLDVNVTKGINHLLKSPFCIHAKTGKVCVPLRTSDEALSSFDPENVPRVDQLCNEIISAAKDQSALDIIENETDSVQRKVLDYKKTSLKPYIEFFEQFVNSVCESSKPKTAEPTLEF